MRKSAGSHTARVDRERNAIAWLITTLHLMSTIRVTSIRPQYSALFSPPTSSRSTAFSLSSHRFPPSEKCNGKHWTDLTSDRQRCIPKENYYSNHFAYRSFIFFIRQPLICTLCLQLHYFLRMPFNVECTTMNALMLHKIKYSILFLEECLAIVQ